jgi:hypothetical protein
MMQMLNLPVAPLKLSRLNGSIYVFCTIRKKKLLLTPEEWVRQHCIHFLIKQKGISLSKIASELSIAVQGQQRRCDVVVFNNELKAEILVECKAPEITLNEKVVDQIIQYNSILNVKKLWITNGLVHYFLIKNDQNGNWENISETHW